MRIAFTDDILRHVDNQLQSYPANRETLCGAILPAARKAGVALVAVSSTSCDVELSVPELMEALQLPLGQQGWTQAWDAQSTPAFEGLLGKAFSGVDVVIGWGMSNVMLRAFEKLDIGYFDIELSPYRYAQNFYFMARTNVAGLADVVRMHEVTTPTMEALAGELNAFHNRRRVEYLAGPGVRCGVLLGQTPIDAALISNGRIATIDQFLEEIRQWAAPLDRLFFKEHPHGDGTAFAWLQEHFDIESLERPPYQIFSAKDLHGVAAISSGACAEAANFGIAAMTFITNPRHSYQSSSSAFYAALAVRGECLNHALAYLVGAEPPASWFNPDYRSIFSSAWGERFARGESQTDLGRLRVQAGDRAKELEERIRELEERVRELEAMRASISWQITRPIRAVRAGLMRGW